MQGYCKWRPLQHSFAYEIESGNNTAGLWVRLTSFATRLLLLVKPPEDADASVQELEGQEAKEAKKVKVSNWEGFGWWQSHESQGSAWQYSGNSSQTHIRETWTRAAIFGGGKNWEKFPRYIPVALHRGHYLALRFQGCNVALTASLCGGGWSDGQHTHTHTPEKADQKIDAEELLKTCSRTSSCTSRKRARSSGAPALLKTCSSIGHGDQEELLRSCSSVKGTKKEIVEEAPKAEKTKCKKKSLVPKTSPSSQPGVSSEIQEPHEMEAGDIQKPLTAQWANLVWFIWMLTVYGLEKARVNASGQSLPEVGPVNVPQTGPDFNFRYLVEYGLGWIKRFGRIGRIADCF